MEEPVRHELLQLPWDLHEGVHLLTAAKVALRVLLKAVAAGHLAADVRRKGH